MLINEKFNILENLEFPDHYIYNDNDLDKIFIKSNKLNAKIITTEKDYLRIDKSKSENIGFIKSEVKIIEESKIINILINKNEKN
jgi:tetraacyldisaccharide 4'-kinase